MVSVIITTYNELDTLPRALEAILKEKVADEILVVAPDEETERLIEKKYPQVRFLKNEKIVKPAGLNLGIKEAKGEIVILTDGDVLIKEGSLNLLLKALEKKEVGLSCGQPTSLNPKDNMLGFWSHFLTFAAHKLREKSKIFPASGNLYAFKKNLFSPIYEKTMVDDALITAAVVSCGYRIVYVPEARVYVKYPENFKDWIKQKVRATGGYIEKSKISSLVSLRKFRNLWQEILMGFYLFFTYPKSLKEFWWTKLLYLARIYLWFLIFWQIKIRKKGIKDLWKRVESTKKL
ncbi:hypothetical protein COW09_01150 [bacterium (Candidatus Moisslbacteria) CG12_big_fil_rev_8_21_14_0_65_36_11]|nr:MAG: hypothetical protein COW09_01150 [bacterium (Candidatus Moisslbacteria) CG12_big_fil_rev_8_21_14_0_65_36_11]